MILIFEKNNKKKRHFKLLHFFFKHTHVYFQNVTIKYMWAQPNYLKKISHVLFYLFICNILARNIINFSLLVKNSNVYVLVNKIFQDIFQHFCLFLYIAHILWANTYDPSFALNKASWNIKARVGNSANFSYYVLLWIKETTPINSARKSSKSSESQISARF